jgi:hypothetical protein
LRDLLGHRELPHAALSARRLAVNLLRDKPALSSKSSKDVGQIPDVPQRLLLHTGDDENIQPNKVTDISGKHWRR